MSGLTDAEYGGLPWDRGGEEAMRAAINKIIAARVAEVTAERDAYRRAKQENDERFQIEAGEQRDRANQAEAERDQAREASSALLHERNSWARRLADACDERDTAKEETEKFRLLYSGADNARTSAEIRAEDAEAESARLREELRTLAERYLALRDIGDYFADSARIARQWVGEKKRRG